MRTPLHQLTGVDLSQIDGIGPYTALRLVAEIGTDMRRWPTAKHFTSWLTLAPQNRISGGRRLSSRTQPSANRAARFSASPPCRSAARTPPSARSTVGWRSAPARPKPLPRPRASWRSSSIAAWPTAWSIRSRRGGLRGPTPHAPPPTTATTRGSSRPRARRPGNRRGLRWCRFLGGSPAAHVTRLLTLIEVTKSYYARDRRESQQKSGFFRWRFRTTPEDSRTMSSGLERWLVHWFDRNCRSPRRDKDAISG